MSDDLRGPVGTPMDEDDGADEGEVTEGDYEEVADMDEVISDDPAYDPAKQAPVD